MCCGSTCLKSLQHWSCGTTCMCSNKHLNSHCLRHGCVRIRGTALKPMHKGTWGRGTGVMLVHAGTWGRGMGINPLEVQKCGSCGMHPDTQLERHGCEIPMLCGSRGMGSNRHLENHVMRYGCVGTKGTRVKPLHARSWGFSRYGYKPWG